MAKNNVTRLVRYMKKTTSTAWCVEAGDRRPCDRPRSRTKDVVEDTTTLTIGLDGATC
jgi:hypothetical protein